MFRRCRLLILIVAATWILSLPGISLASTYGAGGYSDCNYQTGVNGDLNADCQVSLTDLSILLANWNSSTNAACDLNHNGRVDIFDLSILLSNYGQ